MRVTMDRDALAEAVAWTTRVLPGRPALPVLAGVLLEAGDTGTADSDPVPAASLRLSCFDYEVSARTTTVAQIHESGRALVQGRLLADIARTLPAADVELSLDGGKLSISCRSTRFALPLMPVEDYPRLPAVPEALGTVPGDVFGAAVGQVAVAAARDETPPVLTTVKVEIEGDTVTMVATDRYRLSLREFAWAPGVAGEQRSFLVRSRTLHDVARSLSGAEVELRMSPEGGNLLGIGSGEKRVTVPLMDGEYPPVRKLFPTTSTTVAVMGTPELLEGVRRVALVGDRAPIRLSFSGSEVRLESGAGEDAQASDSLPARVDGPDISIAFNATYLLDGLNAAQAPYVRLSFTEATKPALLSGHTAEDGSDERGFTYLLMPIRLAG